MGLKHKQPTVISAFFSEIRRKSSSSNQFKSKAFVSVQAEKEDRSFLLGLCPGLLCGAEQRIS